MQEAIINIVSLERPEDVNLRLAPLSPGRHSAERRDRLVGLGVALIPTLLFMLPMLVRNAEAFVNLWEPQSDTWSALAAQFGLSHYYLNRHIFSAIDIFTHSGASEFFLRPSFPVFQPIFLIANYFLSPGSPTSIAYVYGFVIAFHVFLGAYCTYRLCRRFLYLDTSLSAFASVTTIFSYTFIQTLWYFPYTIIPCLIPVVAYSSLVATRHRSLTQIFLASVAPFLLFTAGYIPTAIIGAAIAGIIIFGVAFANLRASRPLRQKFLLAASSLSSIAIATAVCFPFYIAIFLYHRDVEVAKHAPNIVAVAFNLSENPAAIWRVLTTSFVDVLRRYEVVPYWGPVASLIIILYFCKGRSPTDPLHRMVMASSLIIYLTVFLAIYGDSSALSSIFYYFVPVAGYTHIYQRNILLVQLFFVVCITLMLKSIVASPPIKCTKILIAGMAVLLIAASLAISAKSPVFSFFTGRTLVEIMLSIVFLGSLLLFPKPSVWIGTITSLLIVLSFHYRVISYPMAQFSNRINSSIAYNPSQSQALAKFFTGHSDKLIVRYINLLPGTGPYVPRNFPWFVLPNFMLSDYYGYEWHTGVNFEYRRLMDFGVNEPEKMNLRPNWEWLRVTGAQFALFREGDTGVDPKLAEFADYSDPAKVYRFAGNGEKFVVVPLKFSGDGPNKIRFDNGFLRALSDDSSTTVSSFTTDYAGSVTALVDSRDATEVEYLFWKNAHLKALVDGREVTTLNKKGLLSVSVPAGRHEVKFVYRNNLVTLFNVMALIYGLILVVSIVVRLSGVRYNWKVERIRKSRPLWSALRL